MDDTCPRCGQELSRAYRDEGWLIVCECGDRFEPHPPNPFAETLAAYVRGEVSIAVVLPIAKLIASGIEPDPADR